MNERTDQCQYPGCNLPSEMVYLGAGLCDKHWEKICDMPKEKIYKKLRIKHEVPAGICKQQ